MIKKFFVLSSLTIGVALFAQQKHTIVKGDTPYNLSKKYGMSLDDLYKLNPTVKDGSFKIGDIISVKGKNSAVATTSGKTGKIALQPKQTLYGLTKQYHVTEADIRRLNPNLQMQIGEEIILPAENIQKYADASAFVTTATTPSAPVTNTKPSTKEELSSEYYYTVQDKDNYYKVGRKFGIQQSQLFMMNPGLEEKGLKPGDVIRIKPTSAKETVVNREETTSSPSVNETRQTSSSLEDYATYTVQNGDTVFGIINKYGITLDQLIELNPGIVSGLKSGMILKIKKLDAAYVKKNGDALNVVLMLPFGFDTNDSKFRAMSTDFLTGAKLAIERNSKAGLQLDINVVDAGNEKSFKNSLSQINSDNTDLIIGPFFKSNILEVLNYVGDKKIPVVAPFANSEDLYDYSNLIIMETSDDVYSDRIVKEVAQGFSNEKIYILADSDKNNSEILKKDLTKALKNPQITVVTSANDIQLDKNMVTGQSAPIIAILASSDDNLGNSFTNKIINLAKEVNGLRTYSMYHTPSFDKYVDEVSQANLVYLMDRKINTDGTFEKQILEDYKDKYCKSPSKYAVIGFDVVNDILTRENKKGEVLKQMNKSQTQLATKFEFVRAKSNGAFVNTGYRVVRLIPQ